MDEQFFKEKQWPSVLFSTENKMKPRQTSVRERESRVNVRKKNLLTLRIV